MNDLTPAGEHTQQGQPGALCEEDESIDALGAPVHEPDQGGWAD